MADTKFRTLFEVLLVLLVLVSLVFVASEAANQYSLVKPFIAYFTAAPEPLKVDVIDLLAGYNVNASRYDNVTVAVRNNGWQPLSGSVTVQFYDILNNVIAYGTGGLPDVTPNSTFYVNIPLTWQANATITDYASLTVSVYRR